ncbi:unnamed protein product [Adineta steineri]|uniref:EB domain-containing protein n=1 Tax=Adineta steineri TaxID=433720 RepID=A0A819XMW2_9BILA|nr:unnamed protein product [Adineta steineri]
MWLVILLLLIKYVVSKTIYYENVLGYKCQTNENCFHFVPNSICVNNKCICQFGYRSNGLSECVYELRYRRQVNFGIRMLGEECFSNDECRRTPVDGAKICLLNQCQCTSGHVPIDAYRCIRDFEQLPSNTRIIKSSDKEDPPGYGSICLTNRDCQHSTVRLECLRGTCVCLDGYVPLGKYLCYNILGEGEPVIEDLIWTSSLPTTTFISDIRDDELIKSLGKLGATCTDDYYCRQSVSQSHCYNGKCSCMDNYISLDSYTCTEDKNQDLISATISAAYKSLLGGKCQIDQNCQTGDAVCLNNICTCPNDYFPIDDWNCLADPDLIKIKTTVTTTTTTTTTTPTTTGFIWWPWSPSSTTSRSVIMNAKNTFPFRCVLNRQCFTIDIYSHCTSFGRCVCNIGYKLETINNEQKCVRKLNNENDCD